MRAIATRNTVLAPLIILGLMIAGLFAAPPVLADHPADPAHDCKGSFLGIDPWHKYLEVADPETCTIDAPNGFLEGNIPWLIAAAVLEMLLKVAAITAVIMTIAGGYQIMTSAGTPEGLAAGRNKILSAITGFVIAIMATVMVSYLVGSLAGSAPPDPRTGLPQTDASNNALNFIFGLIYRIAAGVSVIFIALSGFKFVTGGGNPQQIAQARQSIYYALIGLVVVLVSVSIIALVGGRL